MSKFIKAKGNSYTYIRCNKEYIISSKMLNVIFKTHGYCVDPGDKLCSQLDHDDVINLKELANNAKDYSLVKTINLLINELNPKVASDCDMHKIIMEAKDKYNNLNSQDKIDVQFLIKTVLNIGLYLGGWKGCEEPYITELCDNKDIIKLQFKIFTLIHLLYSNPNYYHIKLFPIILYNNDKQDKNIDQCINMIEANINDINYGQMAKYLISTSYYYITAICNVPYPMLSPLMNSLKL